MFNNSLKKSNADRACESPKSLEPCPELFYFAIILPGKIPRYGVRRRVWILRDHTWARSCKDRVIKTIRYRVSGDDISTSNLLCTFWNCSGNARKTTFTAYNLRKKKESEKVSYLELWFISHEKICKNLCQVLPPIKCSAHFGFTHS